ncbi:hypothetical protein N657DRAFT_395601 [Parathielavia appendiculata]|uniref:Uncharacterized protein n=1 Tax=Parathielavia appendiculata TaxID=2587402 RepID=A0AAN6Z3S5_9PEZI|nr:hypothetical protein N657DRAFT_395601 [Parathielavia appendiculata]
MSNEKSGCQLSSSPDPSSCIQQVSLSLVTSCWFCRTSSALPLPLSVDTQVFSVRDAELVGVFSVAESEWLAEGPGDDGSLVCWVSFADGGDCAVCSASH